MYYHPSSRWLLRPTTCAGCDEAPYPPPGKACETCGWVAPPAHRPPKLLSKDTLGNLISILIMIGFGIIVLILWLEIVHDIDVDSVIPLP